MRATGTPRQVAPSSADMSSRIDFTPAFEEPGLRSTHTGTRVVLPGPARLESSRPSGL
ncbi:hypothetical protein [Nonomuraea jabiensis]|uniref:hypothetical protein n=1 Tax=Nonomuraea jabiensis TaxID=882448 RepID=UPI003D724C29